MGDERLNMELTANAFIRLRPDLQLLEDEHKIVLCGDAGIVIHEPPAPLRHILRGLANPAGMSCAHVLAMASGVLTMTLSHLQQAGLLQHSATGFALAQCNTSAYFDATLLRPDGEQSVSVLGVAVVGCGGIGGELLRHMVSSGARRLYLMDDDVVTPSNLNRQYLFAQRHIGCGKAEAAKSALLELCPDVQVTTKQQRVLDHSDLAWLDSEEIHAIVCCADTPLRQVRRAVGEYAHRRQLWFACASVGIFRGYWGPIVPPGGQPYHRWPRASATSSFVDGLRPPLASFGPTNSLISAFLARDLLHALLGAAPASLNTRCSIDFQTHSTSRLGPEGGHA